MIDQPRQSQRYQPKVSSDEPALLKDILNLVREFPRYGYRLICGKLRQLGWTINPKRVYRIWKKEGLKVPIKKQKKRRMGDSTNASHRQRAEHPNHVWSWDFIFDRTASGKALKWLNIVDEFTRIRSSHMASFKNPGFFEKTFRLSETNKNSQRTVDKKSVLVV